jgi:hypothetical protein
MRVFVSIDTKWNLDSPIFRGILWGILNVPKTRCPKTPKLVHPLTDVQIRNAKPKGKPYKLADGGGLYVEAMPIGSKLWRMKFKQANGKESPLAFGNYPDISILEARKKRAEARALMVDGIDPAKDRKQKKDYPKR